ncbi:MAG: cytochrome c biogenesis protein CcsA [Verrucomicrobia bacterium]|nr:cytochrome c biogenesis protein CcsA [Verrucomicrobiota bacterium]
MSDRILMLLASVGYLGAVAVFAWYTRRQLRAPEWVTLSIIGVSFCLHSYGLHSRGLERGSCPITNPYEVFLFISWSVMLLFLLTGPVFRTSFLGVFSAALAGLMGVLASVVPAWDAGTRGPYFGGNPWIETHAALSIFSYGVFGLLAATACMYLLQYRSLRSKRYGMVARFLPSIVQLDHVNLRLLLVGTAFFTLSLGIGFFYWVNHPEAVSELKLATAGSVWLAYSAVLFFRWRRQLQGPRLAWTALALFFFALLVLWPVELSRNSGRIASSHLVIACE